MSIIKDELENEKKKNNNNFTGAAFTYSYSYNNELKAAMDRRRLKIN